MIKNKLFKAQREITAELKLFTASSLDVAYKVLEFNKEKPTIANLVNTAQLIAMKVIEASEQRIEKMVKEVLADVKEGK